MAVRLEATRLVARQRDELMATSTARKAEVAAAAARCDDMAVRKGALESELKAVRGDMFERVSG